MSDPYEKAKGGRLSFKGGGLASRSKAIDKKKKKKKKANEDTVNEEGAELMLHQEVDGDGGTEEIFTIDAAKRRKYDDLFPVEAKKFGYDPKAKSKSVEEALDDRVKKKADRYCK